MRVSSICSVAPWTKDFLLTTNVWFLLVALLLLVKAL
ncbi:hypothetical protein Krac_9603 [Ktedonobacter racemifer DSM 44963]|uniref:Uncharacterized protein n=1 Tax=Ktedonobacter racemifer DSM 44963 TaxID=485913 RepID=D6TCT0_KTERA|nr:hypothetical protein Krac_9603 [Ktedonobacter racemifer DSM 44963]